MIVEEKTISSEMIYEGAILNLRRDKVTVKDGKTAYREIIEHNGAVALVPVTADGKVVMVRQYRKACEKALLEIPAGKIDRGCFCASFSLAISIPTIVLESSSSSFIHMA